MRDLIRHMLTPNPENRPDIHEIEDLLETWDDFDTIQLNPDAEKLKAEEMRKLGQQLEKARRQKTKSSNPKDLTPEEIREFQKKVQKQRMDEQRKQHVPLHKDYSKKMEEQLYSKKAEKSTKKSSGKKEDFDWDEFGSSSNFIFINYIDTQKKTTQIKGDFEFDFDFNSQGKKKEEAKARKDTTDSNDFFGTSENTYCTEPQDDWFDNSQKKPKKVQKKEEPKKKNDDFEFDFDNQPSKANKKPSADFFDFDNNDQPTQKKTENVMDDFENVDLIGPQKPQFDDYFPEENDQDEIIDSADSGLISNLRKLYQKEGVIPEEQKKEDENILKPDIPDAIKQQNKFTPEVKMQGDNFWEERNNPHIASQGPNYHHLSVLGAQPQYQNNYNQMAGGSNLHISKSSNALSPPTEFPTQPNIAYNIHRSHSSDASKGKKKEKDSPGVFGELYQTSVEQFQ